MVTGVVDALDEARDPARCVRDVLARSPSTRASRPVPDRVPPALAVRRRPPPPPAARAAAVAGVRSASPATPAGRAHHDLLSELRAVFPTAQEVRTDGVGVERDIAGYLRALLGGERGWSERDLTEVAGRVAARVGRSFLDARLAAEQLRDGGRTLLEDPGGWRSWTGARWGCSRRTWPGSRRTSWPARGAGAAAGDGLRPGARGAVGPGVARGRRGRAPSPIEDADEKIGRLLKSHLAGYLTHDSEDDRVVYRPAHERLGGVLRRWPKADAGQGGSARDGRGGVGATLGPGGPGGPGSPGGPGGGERTGGPRADRRRPGAAGRRARERSPPPYVRRHLAHHARLGGVLDDEHVPPGALPWDTGGGVRALLATEPGPGPGPGWTPGPWSSRTWPRRTSPPAPPACG
ncbi:hypothetical protein NKH77_32585 [Streptomyces sp. M19]